MPGRPHQSEPLNEASGKRPRGRPPGSVALTPEIQHTIVAYVRAGAFPHVAAQAAGISPRTYFDWMARGEDRHPTRPSTPKLRAFAQAVNQAHAEARIAAEVRVYKENPLRWLTYSARSKPDRDGWSIPPASEHEESDSGGLLERWIAEVERIQTETGRCTSPHCPCQAEERSGWDGIHRDAD